MFCQLKHFWRELWSKEGLRVIKSLKIFVNVCNQTTNAFYILCNLKLEYDETEKHKIFKVNFYLQYLVGDTNFFNFAKTWISLNVFSNALYIKLCRNISSIISVAIVRKLISSCSIFVMSICSTPSH